MCLLAPNVVHSLIFLLSIGGPVEPLHTTDGTPLGSAEPRLKNTAVGCGALYFRDWQTFLSVIK